jgi:hypothetical protein
MHDLEQRAQRLVQDWKALRQGLEHVQQEHRLGQFYAMHLDHIEASLVEVPELVYCVVSDLSSSDNLAHARILQTQSTDGLATLIRRMRQAAEDIDMDD